MSTYREIAAAVREAWHQKLAELREEKRWYEDGAPTSDDDNDPVTASIAREVASIEREISSLKRSLESLN
jgi:hypothetical protein